MKWLFQNCSGWLLLSEYCSINQLIDFRHRPWYRPCLKDLYFYCWLGTCICIAVKTVEEVWFITWSLRRIHQKTGFHLVGTFPYLDPPLLLFLQSTLMWFHTEIETFWFLFTSFTYWDKFWSYNWSKTKVLGLNSRPTLEDLCVSGQLLIKPFHDFYSIEDMATKF